MDLNKAILNALLNLAMRGKLVEQNTNDEPASKLIERIKQEKQDLIAQGKIKKDKNESIIFRGNDGLFYERIGKNDPIRIEVPFDIPNSWEWGRLKSYSSIAAGGTPDRSKKEYWIDGNIPWLKIADITCAEKYVDTCSEYITQLGLKNSSAKLFKKGTILYSIFATIGETKILNFDASTNQAIAGIEINHNMNIEFYYYFLLYCKKYMKSVGRGGVQKNINQSIVSNILIPIPPLEEQQRISKKLSILFEKISIVKKAKENLKHIKKRLLNQTLNLAMRGKLVEQNTNDEPASKLIERIKQEKQDLIAQGKIKKDKNESIIFRGNDGQFYERIGKNDPIRIEVPFDIPNSWEWVRAKTFSSIYTGNSINADVKRKNYSKPAEFDFISTSDIGFDGVINYDNGVWIPSSESKFNIAPKNKNLICIEGGSAGKKIGKVDRDVCFGNKLACINTFIISDDFINYYIKSPVFSCLFKDSLSGMIPGVNINELKDMLVPIPPLDEQNRIAKKISSIEEILNYEK